MEILMAQACVSFIPSFVSYATMEKPVEQVKAFNTSRTGADKVSAPVLIEAMHYDDSAKSIKVFCSDGHLRECRVARLPSVEHGRTLWRQLQEIGKSKSQVQFKAAGGFSADKWFYTVI